MVRYGISLIVIISICLLGLNRPPIVVEKTVYTVDTLVVLENNIALYTLPQSSPLPECFVGSRRFSWLLHPVFRKMRMHKGIDMPCDAGTKLYAQGNGRIIRAGWASGYGKVIYISHGLDSLGREITVRYGHLSSLNVMKEDFIKKGELLGKTGTTGTSTGPHLHYEYHISGEAVDPLKYLWFDQEKLNRFYPPADSTQSMFEVEYLEFHQLPIDDAIAIRDSVWSDNS